MADTGIERRFVLRRGVWGVLALTTGLVIAACWAIAQANVQTEEEKVRTVARDYYSATIAGDADRCVATVRLPMTVISNGLTSSRNERQLRALLARVAARADANPLTPEERALVDERLHGMFQDADITFIGANTAAVDFLLRAGVRPEEGDLIAMLILHRRTHEWRVIAEIHDSAPVPRNYLRPLPPLPSADFMPPSTDTQSPTNGNHTPTDTR